MSIVLLALAFMISYAASRHSLVSGLRAVLTVGYAYGIIRANVPQTLSHFLFDAAVLGLFSAQLFTSRPRAERTANASLYTWLWLLTLWPIALTLIPVQDPLIQIVGLRGNIFLLPFMALGAWIRTEEDFVSLATWFAGLNLVAFGFAVAEFVVGIELFFPRNAVTQLIYQSKDLAGATAYRIPATFTSAHAYAASMVMSIPLTVGAWARGTSPARSALLVLGALASMIGVFMAGARTHMVILAAIGLTALFAGTLPARTRTGVVVALLLVGIVVTRDDRLQRYETLQDTEYVGGRLHGSVNQSLLHNAVQYPMGNGMGGGGTSIPYFLQGRIKEQVLIENEYGKIMLEQGIPGLALWLIFIFWAFRRAWPSPRVTMRSAHLLAWVGCAGYFGSSLAGTGLLTSIPNTATILLLLGWMISRRRQSPAIARRVLIPAPLPSRSQVVTAVSSAG